MLTDITSQGVDTQGINMTKVISLFTFVYICKKKTSIYDLITSWYKLRYGLNTAIFNEINVGIPSQVLPSPLKPGLH